MCIYWQLQFRTSCSAKPNHRRRHYWNFPGSHIQRQPYLSLFGRDRTCRFEEMERRRGIFWNLRHKSRIGPCRIAIGGIEKVEVGTIDINRPSNSLFPFISSLLWRPLMNRCRTCPSIRIHNSSDSSKIPPTGLSFPPILITHISCERYTRRRKTSFPMCVLVSYIFILVDQSMSIGEKHRPSSPSAQPCLSMGIKEAHRNICDAPRFRHWQGCQDRFRRWSEGIASQHGAYISHFSLPTYLKCLMVRLNRMTYAPKFPPLVLSPFPILHPNSRRNNLIVCWKRSNCRQKSLARWSKKWGKARNSWVRWVF